jgi:glutamate:GABA antiporter
MAKPQKILTTTALALISVAAVVNLRNLPVMASVGLNSVFFYLLAGLVFLLPSALVCAELASSWDKPGGIYLWVHEAFGPKAGFFSIWSEWFNNVISTPVSLVFLAATIAYIFAPSLVSNKLYMMVTMLVIVWGATLFNFLGIKASSRLNMFGAFFGTLIPGAIIAILGLIWFLSGHPIEIKFTWANFFPPMHIKNIVFFLGVLSAYAGMQITAFHVQNVKNPARDFPRAIALAVVLILAVTILSSLAIAGVVPQQQLNLVSGVMEGFSVFLVKFHLEWALPILIFLIVFSGLSSMSAWILGPARGLLVAAQQGLFPRWFAKENKNGMPTRILLIQATISTGLSLLFLLMPTFSAGFWMLLVLTSQFTLVMYILVFSAAIRLRYNAPHLTRSFRIPGGNIGMWIVAGVSIVVCASALVLGYFPPAQLDVGKLSTYETVLVVGNLCYLLFPVFIYKYARNND